MMEQEKWKTAAEIIAEQNANPEFLRKQAARAKRRQEQAERFAELERPVIDRMKALGFDASSITDAIHKYSPLSELLVELLLDSISQSSEVKLLQWLIRALAAAGRPFNGQPLIECYHKSNDIELRWVILNTIACAKPHSIDDWIAKVSQDPYVAETLQKLGYKK